MPSITHLTPAELAGRWHITTAALRSQRSKGTGPTYIQIGARRVLYAIADIEAYEAERKVEPVA
ncbi:MAG: DNA-binding protein [Rhodospirillaceae bacterium]